MYPEQIMADVLWIFKGQSYASRDEFISDVSAYNMRIHKKDWEPDEVVLNSKTVKVFYEYWNDDMDVSAESVFTASGDSFTAAELLYLINQELADKELGDHVFFEGLYNEKKNGKAEYLIFLGS